MRERAKVLLHGHGPGLLGVWKGGRRVKGDTAGKIILVTS
jgi:hypothetical protein